MNLLAVWPWHPMEPRKTPRGTVSIERVLVVYKKSPYQHYVQECGDPSLERAIASDDPVALNLRERHQVQDRALAQVQDRLKVLGVRLESCWRGDLHGVKGWDLVVAVGGDGTLLDVAHSIVDTTPLLGVNSDPDSSVGILCAATAEDFREQFQAIAAGTLRPTPHERLRIRLDGEELFGPCLNDVLFAHKSPADMSRFHLCQVPRDEAEEITAASENVRWSSLRGSGIWVSTATGSTAAIRSAGGKVQPLRSRRLQYLLREPYTPPHQDPATAPHGYLPPDQALVMVSRMHGAHLWADGPHRQIAVHYGQRIIVDLHPQPLMLMRNNYR